MMTATKFLLLFFVLLITGIANGTTYYVSSTGNDNNNGTSADKPWQSLAKVQNAGNNNIIEAGDSILFKKGDSFSGSLIWATIWGYTCATGTSSEPIFFGAYGNGEKPVFQYSAENPVPAEKRILLWFLGVDYIIIDGLNFTDLLDTKNDKVTPGNCGIPVYLGITGEATTNHCVIRNIDISLCGMGVVIVGDHNKITRSRLTNFRNLKSTPNTGGNTAYEDYGANAITITGSDNEISGNYISGAWAESLDFGWNGGACEMYNTCNRNKLIYNTFYDCGGISEFGAQEKGATAADNLVAYNKIINCGGLTYCNISGEFTIQVSNVQYFNNTIIETSASRFSGPNTGKGIFNAEPRALIVPEAALFTYNGNPSANTLFNIRNNVFYLCSGIDILKSDSDLKKITHENNIYQLCMGSKTNYTLSPSELYITNAVFNDTSSADPLLWDYNLADSIVRKNGLGSASLTANPYSLAVISIIVADAIFKIASTPSGTLFDFSPKHIIEIIKTFYKYFNFLEVFI